MKMKMRPRYYCEHCKKSGGSAHHMRRHEVGCTANPNRVCGMCAVDRDQFDGEHEQALTEALIAAAEADWQTGLETGDPYHEQKPVKLREVSHDCPACMLAGIRLSGVYLDFNFKDEAAAFWADRQRGMAE